MSHELIEIKRCEVCGNHELTTVLNLGLQPLCDDLIPVGDSRICIEYPIEILFCNVCVTAHQRYQVPKQELFPSSYHYRSRFTADVLDGMARLVESCESRFGSLSDKTILDIGCNDGSLLDIFRKRGAVTIGIEPTDACNDASLKDHVVLNDYLSIPVAKDLVSQHGNPDIITFTNVFAHIENLNDALSSLKCLIKPETVIVIENHYLGSILGSNQFDTFYHEHPRTYSYKSFTHIADSLGVQLLDVEFPSRYGGNIRVFLGNEKSIKHENKYEYSDMNGLNTREERFFENFQLLQKNVERYIDMKKSYIDSQIKKFGILNAKAFPGRAAILIKLLELNENSISAVYEKPGSLKIGHYLPGTRIPIFSDEELFSLPDQAQPILNLAWHIPNEIHGYLTANGYCGEIIDILTPEDFAVG